MPEPQPWLETPSPTEFLISLVLDPGKRISVLLITGYVSGVAGLLLSFYGNTGDPLSGATVGGIALMSLSFLCLFVLSVTMVNLTDVE